MSKIDEETCTDSKRAAISPAAVEINEKTNVNIPETTEAAAAAAMAGAEELSTLSPTETVACTVVNQQQQQQQQQQLTPKSRNSKRSSKSNKSTFKKATSKTSRELKETYFDATSLNSASSLNDETSVYSMTNGNLPATLIVQQNTPSTPLVLPAPTIFSSGSLQSNNNNTYVDNVITKDPIVIRGAGNITIFGVCNKFNEQFPTQLNAKLAPEEFRDTIKQINSILQKELENSFKWLVFGSIFCCCTLGCSLLPVIYMNKKAKLCISKLLDMENQRLYLKLGLKWRLAKLKCNSNSLFEYVLLIEFLPTLLLYQPD